MGDTTTVEKPIFKEGGSVADIWKGNQETATTPAAIESTPVDTTPTTAATPTVATPTTETTTPALADTTIPAVEENVSSFKFQDFEEAAPTTETPAATTTTPAAAQPQTGWKDAIKTLDRKEILKELGVSDFAVEIDDHYRNGGDPADYLNAKAIDWNKVTDESIIKDDLKRMYPNLLPNQVDRLFEKKYGVTDPNDPIEKEDADILLKSDAYAKRQQRIAEQSKFKIAAPIQPVQQTNQAELEKQAQEQQRQLEESRNWYNNHEATKSLMTSKRVALSLGDNGTFNFSVEKPEYITKALTDSDFWQKLTSNKQGEPDIAKQQKLALYALNPEQFESDLVNYGKTLGLRDLVKDGQNITRTTKVVPMETQKNEGEKWKTETKSSTFGG